MSGSPAATVGATPVGAMLDDGAHGAAGEGESWSAGVAGDGEPWSGSGAGSGLDAELVVVLRPHVVPGLDDDDLLAALADAEAAGRRVDAVRAALAAEVAERSRRELGPERLCARRGCRTPVELVQRVAGASAAAVNRRIRLGSATRPRAGLTGQPQPPRFPAVAWALEEGLLGTDAASAVVDTLGPATRVAGAEAVGVAERSIVDGAAGPMPDAPPVWDADAVRVQALAWRAALDPDGAVPSELDVERRFLTLGAPSHGLVRMRGLVLPEVAAALERYADAWTDPRSASLPVPAGVGDAGGSVRGEVGASAARVGEAGMDEPGPGEVGASAAGAAGAREASSVDAGAALSDRRSRAQRLHDVLAAAVSVAARAADAPSVAGNPATLVVTVRAEDLAAGRGVAWAQGRPVGVGAAAHVGCAGAVERVVLGRGGRIVGLGSRERCFTGQQRRAIAVRDGTCVIPGCHVPAGWCEVHHVVPHAADPDGTHTDNGVLLCWYHHRTLDTSGWEVRMRAGTPEVRAPRWIDPQRGWHPVTPGVAAGRYGST